MSDVKYIVTDEDGKERETHFYEILQKSGLVEKAKKMGRPILAVHDSELLKAERIEEYESAKLKHLKERNLKQLKTTEQDLNFFYYTWLLTEDKKCDGWKERSNSNSDKIEIFKYQSYIKNELTVTELKINPPTKIDIPKTSYLWQGNLESEVEILYHKMLGSCIAKETTIQQFKNVFNGQGVTEHIQWLPASNLLAYFISTLLEKKKIRKDIDQSIWLIASNCFTKSNSLSQKVDQYNNNNSGKPRNHELIDQLF